MILHATVLEARSLEAKDADGKTINIIFSAGALVIHVCLFDLIFYVPSTIFQLKRDGSSWVEPVLSKH